GSRRPANVADEPFVAPLHHGELVGLLQFAVAAGGGTPDDGRGDGALAGGALRRDDLPDLHEGHGVGEAGDGRAVGEPGQGLLVAGRVLLEEGAEEGLELALEGAVAALEAAL